MTAKPKPMQGKYSDRPPASSVKPGTVYIATDIGGGAKFTVDGERWVQQGKCELTNLTLPANCISVDATIPTVITGTITVAKPKPKPKRGRCGARLLCAEGSYHYCGFLPGHKSSHMCHRGACLAIWPRACRRAAKRGKAKPTPRTT